MQLHQDQIFDDNVAITVTRDGTNKLMIAGASGVGTFNNNELDGNDLNVNVDITQVFAGGTSLQVSIFGSADDATYDTVPLIQSGVIPLARLTLGNRIQIPLPSKIPTGFTIPKYIKVTYTVVGTMTTGKVVSYLMATRAMTV